MEPKSDSMAQESDKLSVDCEGDEISEVGNSNKPIVGVLKVYLRQAREIHNICIYHNQDVYAKIFLTDDPEQAALTHIVNEGGKNPVFNETLWVNVRTIECLLRCEIWMMSRIRNYMQDQLLGFALVSLCDVVSGNGKASGEFALSSCDLFHSPAGFVQLTTRYTGALPGVLQMDVPTPAHLSGVAYGGGDDSGTPDSVPCELEKIEFPDPKIVNENEKMVSEYLEMPCTSLECQTSEQIDSASANVNQTCAGNILDDITQPVQTPPLRVPTDESASVSIPKATQRACETARPSKSPSKEDVSPSKGNTDEARGAEESVSPVIQFSTFATTPLIRVSAVPEQKVVQQEIVDTYTKSMQQFTESLAKIKLPMYIECESNAQNGKRDSKSCDSVEKVMEPKCDKSQRVFYGSRAFF